MKRLKTFIPMSHLSYTSIPILHLGITKQKKQLKVRDKILYIPKFQIPICSKEPDVQINSLSFRSNCHHLSFIEQFVQAPKTYLLVYNFSILCRGLGLEKCQKMPNQMVLCSLVARLLAHQMHTFAQFTPFTLIACITISLYKISFSKLSKLHLSFYKLSSISQIILHLYLPF